MALAVEAAPGGGAAIFVLVTPGAPRAKIAGEHGDGSLKIAVREPPERGRANEGVVELVAKALGVSRRDVEIASGETSRRKRVIVRGVTPEEVRRRLEKA